MPGAWAGRVFLRALLFACALLGLGLPAAAQTLPRGLPLIDEIQFTGHELFKGDKLFFSDHELRQQMLLQLPSWRHPLRPPPPYQRNLFPKELRRIENFYRRHGFGGVQARLDTVIVLSTSQPEHVALRVHIREGPRTVLREVRYSPQDVFTLEELRRATPIKAGDAYPFGGPQRGRVTRALRLAYAARGFLMVSVSDSSTVAADSSEAALILNIKPGPRFRVAHVKIEGNKETREDVIRRELRFKEDEVYSYTRILESQQNLYNTTLFRSVVIDETHIDLEAKTVDLLVQVLERKARYVEGSVGVGRRDEYEARVVGRWGHRNVGGRGHALELSSTFAYNLEKAHDNFFVDERLRYVHRRFLSSILGPDTRLVPELAYSFDRRIEDVTLQRTAFDTQLFWKQGRFTTLSAGVFAAFTTTTLEKTDDFLETRALTASVTRNSSDNLFNPKRGELRVLSASRAGFWGDNHFTRLTGTYARYTPFKGWVLAFDLRAGWVESFGPSREDAAADIGIRGVPFEFLFQAGGNTTVRGFDNNSLGAPVTVTSVGTGTAQAVVDTVAVRAGTVFLISNIELRMPVPLPLLRRSKLNWVLFMDAGNVWRDIHELEASRFGPRFSEPYAGAGDLRYSYGFGLRYATPFGPIRIDLGFPLKDFGRRKLHLGLGHTF